MSRQLHEAVSRLIRDAVEVYRDDPEAVSALADRAGRLDEPLRIAVAGMVKAGKSTLINAIVGEEIAPTDAGECTRTVTWYRYGELPRITVHPVVGQPRSLPVEEVDGRASVDLSGVRADEVARVVVQWPAPILRDLTLIDTPGIASLSGGVSEHSNRFLIPDQGPSEADAIIYVLRHLHQADLSFLKALRDTAGELSGVVNALAVLSRADEIGAGRIESLLAARDVATRYRHDEALAPLAIGVIPVAGRLAQTARTLQQSEVDALTKLTTLERKARERQLISVDRFMQANGTDAQSRKDAGALLDRFGLFGIRLAAVLIQNGFVDRERLAGELTRRSGLDDLLGFIGTQFRVRAGQLKARAAIAGVETLMRQRPRFGTDALAAAIERIVAETHEFRELRVLATAHTSGVPLAPELTAEMVRLVGGGGLSPAERLGLRPEAPHSELQECALAHVRQWRLRAEHPLTDRATAELCRIVVRSCEGVLAQTHDGSRARSTATLLLGAEPGAGAGEEA